VALAFGTSATALLVRRMPPWRSSQNDRRSGLGGAMETLQQKIVGKFLATLREGKGLDENKIEQVRKLLADSKKPKSDDFIKIFTAPAGGDVK
jgi:hypothetical protein